MDIATFPVTPRNSAEWGSLVGDIGPTEWHDVTQERIDVLTDATGDQQRIHVDPERAAVRGFA